MASDVELVILTRRMTDYVGDDAWIARALSQPVAVVRRREWGAVTERRARLRSGFEVELGLTTPAWASTTPVDPGTAGVVIGGACRSSIPTGCSNAWSPPCRRSPATAVSG